MMNMLTIRKATTNDGESLLRLNELFNGESSLTCPDIEKSLAENEQEMVFVAALDRELVGFCCVQLFKSFCYTVNYAEITELFVDEPFRKQGVGRKLMEYAESACLRHGVKGYQLFTGGSNLTAQTFYEGLDYRKTDEVMYRKRLT